MTLQSDLAAGQKSEFGLRTVYLSVQLFTVHHIFLVHLFAAKPQKINNNNKMCKKENIKLFTIWLCSWASLWSWSDNCRPDHLSVHHKLSGIPNPTTPDTKKRIQNCITGTCILSITNHIDKEATYCLPKYLKNMISEKIVVIVNILSQSRWPLCRETGLVLERKYFTQMWCSSWKCGCCAE